MRYVPLFAIAVFLLLAGYRRQVISAAPPLLSQAAPSATPSVVDIDAQPYPGALPTAVCADGWFSYSHASSGVCGFHCGVRVWLSAGPHDPAELAGTLCPPQAPATSIAGSSPVTAATDPDAPQYAGALPTAVCADGWFSYSHASTGVCAAHAGVLSWLSPGPHDPADLGPLPQIAPTGGGTSSTPSSGS